jgi:release factor glutamine methyltransferase
MATTARADVGSAIATASAALRDAASPTPRLDAELLLAHVIGRDRAWVLANAREPLATEDREAFEAAIARRAEGEPVAYIRGFKEWLSMRLRTDARALIPRPETELLAERAMGEIQERLADGRGPVVGWEVATGSGAVAVALALRFRAAIEERDVRLIASDISADALALAATNLADHCVAALVTLTEADLLEPAGDALPRPDVVVANLPYLSAAEVDAAAGWLRHEPRVALEAGADGLSLIRRLLHDLPRRVAGGATVLLEVAMGQADAVTALAPPGSQVDRVVDLAGVARVVVIRLPA